MQYGQVIRGRFLTRPNRFIAHVALPGGEIGRASCRERV